MDDPEGKKARIREKGSKFLQILECNKGKLPYPYYISLKQSIELYLEKDEAKNIEEGKEENLKDVQATKLKLLK